VADHPAPALCVIVDVRKYNNGILPVRALAPPTRATVAKFSASKNPREHRVAMMTEKTYHFAGNVT
jgi:hypothetical protein